MAMRIPIPERFKISHILIFAVLVFLGQQIERTDLLFSQLCALFICLFGFALNAGGGVLYPSGAYIFFNGILTVLIGIVYKLFLGEPGQSNLRAPITTMAMYCGGMAGMGIAAFFSHRLIPKRCLLADMALGKTMKQAAVGCFVLGAIIQLQSQVRIEGSISSLLGQLNHFVEMGLLLGTTYAIVHSRGKRSTNWIVFAASLWLFFFGLIVFSKEGMFSWLVIWLIACMALGYNFNKLQLVGGVILVSLMAYYLQPYSQYVRQYGVGNPAGNIQVAAHYLSDLNETRRLYYEQLDSMAGSFGPHYYNNLEGIFDRLQMISGDDALTDFTDHGNVYGLAPVESSYLNVIPRFLWPDKPVYRYGNEYGREIGVLAEDDETTGVSFSPAADAYHEAKWWGVFLVLPLVMFGTFFIVDSITGTARQAPWALLPITLSVHAAPEGGMASAVYISTYGMLAVVFIALLSKYVMPLIANLFTGKARGQMMEAPAAELRIR